MPWEWETFGDFLIFATGVEEVRSKAGISFTLSWSQISIVISIDFHTCLVFCLRMYKRVQFWLLNWKQLVWYFVGNSFMLCKHLHCYVTAKNLLLLYHCKIMSRKKPMTPHLLIWMGYDIGTKWKMDSGIQNLKLRQQQHTTNSKQVRGRYILEKLKSNCHCFLPGAFLVPYLIMLVALGIPLLYMELTVGQYIRKGPVHVMAAVCPLLKGTLLQLNIHFKDVSLWQITKCVKTTGQQKTLSHFPP